MKKLVLLFIIGIATITSGTAQPYRLSNTTVNPGEKLTYDLFYNWAFIWIPAGKATMSFSLKQVQQSSDVVYHASLAGATVRNFDPIYRVRDTFEVYMDTIGMLPFYYKEVNHENNYHIQKEYRIQKKDEEKLNFFGTYKKPQKEWKDTISVKNKTVDLVSLLYRLRNIDLSNIQLNDKIHFSMFTNDEAYDLYLTYRGTEVIKLRSGDKYRCKKFSPMMLDTPIFVKGDDTMTIWVSDDENNIIIAAEAKLKMGYAKVMIEDAVYTRYPLLSKIEKKSKKKDS